MKARSFRGGVHPAGHKGLTDNKPIEKCALPEKVVIPLQQHTGSPAEPLVEVGDKVLAGQKIADSTGFISAVHHASISGEVTQIGAAPHPLGRKMVAIEITSDGNDDWIEMPRVGQEDLPAISPGKIRDIVAQNGIVGLGGAAFPTHVKLSPPPDKRLDLYVLNGAECEPYLTCDDRLMRERARDVVAGLKLLMKGVGLTRGIIAVESNKPEAVAALQEQVLKEPGISLEVVRVKYPQGAEKQLINALTGCEVPPGGLPMDVGVAINNVGTAVAVADAVIRGKPLVERAITVTGPAIAEPKNLLVRIGTLVRHVIEQCGGFKEPPAKLISGGPMMGVAQYSLDAPVIKGTSGVVAFTERETAEESYEPCIRCGQCVPACPMRLLPSKLGILIENSRFAEAQDTNLMDCMECGSCVYTCPANRPMVQWIKFAKNELRKMAAREKAQQEQSA
jgi:electron transport complex protein RnfC